MLLHKYPQVAASLRNRHVVYNRSKKMVHQLGSKGELCVIYPEKELDISRTEHDVARMDRTYKEGRKRAQAMMPKIRKYLEQ